MYHSSTKCIPFFKIDCSLDPRHVATWLGYSLNELIQFNGEIPLALTYLPTPVY